MLDILLGVVLSVFHSFGKFPERTFLVDVHPHRLVLEGHSAVPARTFEVKTVRRTQQHQLQQQQQQQHQTIRLITDGEKRVGVKGVWR